MTRRTPSTLERAMSGTIRCSCCSLPIPVTADDVGLTVTCPRTRKLIKVREADVRAGRKPSTAAMPAATRGAARPAPSPPSTGGRTNRALVAVVCVQTLLLFAVVGFVVARERRAANRAAAAPDAAPAPGGHKAPAEKPPAPKPVIDPGRGPAPVGLPALPEPRPDPPPAPVPPVPLPAAPADKVAKGRDRLLALVDDLKAKEPADRIKALEAIAAFGPDANIIGEQLIEAMVDKTPAVRMAAAEALEKVNPKVYPHVFTLLFGMDKGRAVGGLEELGSTAAITVPLLLRLRDDPTNPLSTWGAIAAIAPKDKRFTRVVLAAITDRERRDRFYVLQFLKVIDASTDEKVKVLVTALADGQDMRSVIEALEGFGKDAAPALPLLRKLKFSPDDYIREIATRAIAKIE